MIVKKAQQGLTIRALLSAVLAILLTAFIVEYVERFSSGSPVAENFPPNAAVLAFLFIMGLSSFLYFIHKALRFTKAEMIIVYAAVVLAAPLMTQGLWGRFFGLLAAVPYSQDFKSYESLPRMLWPHGKNLIKDGKFVEGEKNVKHIGGGTVDWQTIDRYKKGKWLTPILSNNGSSTNRCAIEFSIPRYKNNQQQLVPGERYLFSMLIRTEGFTKNSLCFVEMESDGGSRKTVLLSNKESSPTFANPCGFMRIGASPIIIPSDLKSNLIFRVGLQGDGKLAVQDMEFMNVEAIEGLYSGIKLVAERDVKQLDESERGFIAVKPENFLSLKGLKYLLKGFIPWSQWLQPLFAWSLLFGSLFIGLLAVNLIMRKQWAENERLSFPQIIFPAFLLNEEQTAAGKIYYSIFRNRFMWFGLIITLPLVLLKGFNSYNPEIPAPVLSFNHLGSLVTNPELKAFLKDVYVSGAIGTGLSFSLLAIALLIDTSVLFSLWTMFFLFQLWNLFGKIFGWMKFAGYPWTHQQHMGAFLGYALVILFMARKHIADVFRLIIKGKRVVGCNASVDDVDTYRVASLLIVIAFAVLAWWGNWTGMGWKTSLIFFGYMFVVGLVSARIRIETGAPFGYIMPYVGMQFVAAAGGFLVFGATGMMVATIASGFMTTANFLLFSATQIEMLELGVRNNVKKSAMSFALLLGLFGAIFIGGYVFLQTGYGVGADNIPYKWAYQQVFYFNNFVTGEADADRAFLAGTLNSTLAKPFDPIDNIHAKGMYIGMGITFLLGALRQAFTWFPLQPIGYVLAPSYFMGGFWLSAFLAWLIRVVVLRFGGTHAIRNALVPFVIGMFLACIFSLLFFILFSVYLRAIGVTTVYIGLP